MQIARKYKFNILMSLISVFLYLFVIYMFDGSFNINEQYNHNNVSVFAFLLTGLLVIQLTVVCSNAIPLNISFYQTSGMIESLIDDLDNFLAICISSIFFPFFRTLIIFIIFFLFANYFYDAQIILYAKNIIFIFVSLAVYCVSLIGIGLIAASFTIYFKRGNPIIQINTLITTIMGGAIFPISALNVYLQNLSLFVPGKYLMNILRSAINNENFLLNEKVILDFSCLLFLSIVFVLVGIFIIKISINSSLKKDQIFDY